MAGRNDIEKRIEEEKKRQIELRNQLVHSEAFVLGLQEALVLLPKEKSPKQRRHIVGKFRNGSDVKKIYDLLKQSAKPLRVEEILIGIGKEDTKMNRMSISGSLGKYVRTGKIFQRVGPNQFALIGSGHGSIKDSVDLPLEFGADQ